MNPQQRVAPSNFSNLEDDDVETRKVILEEIGKLWKTKSTDPSLYSKVSDGVYARIGKRFSPAILKNVLSKIETEYRKLLNSAIATSDVSNQVMQWWLHSWPYNKAFAFRFKDFKGFEKKKREEKKKEEEEEELRNRAARRLLSAQRRAQRNQTPQPLGNGLSTPTMPAAFGGTQARARAPKRSAPQLAQGAGTPRIPISASGMGNGFLTPSIPTAALGGVQARARASKRAAPQLPQGAAIQQTPHLPIMRNGLPPPANAATVRSFGVLAAGPVQNGPSRADVAVQEVVQVANVVNTFHPNSAGLFERVMKDALLKFWSEMAKGSNGGV
ncbi:hypothetical protein GCK72_025210 [Caenorhabditis remanei]|uniref:Uncharacterized protein n=1 Tax=Caenorhabditis remanei TaxID=31234 RepID=A0A6A5G1S0_CAERE|nr:hypothetical protein GCK72_025210 [Caenorhabditis remanei]KAF1748743.1 hypothetical protein GCK72_025210 [Caenorhabditis remanei]